MSVVLAKLTFSEVSSQDFTISPDARVSVHSKFSDDFWDFNDEARKRSVAVENSAQVLDWAIYTTPLEARKFRPGVPDTGHLRAFLPSGILQELKVLAYLSLALASADFGSGRSTANKPSTVVRGIRALICMFSDIFGSYAKLVEPYGGAPFITSVCDVTLDDIKQAVANSPLTHGDQLEYYLGRLASPAFAKFLPRPLEWNRHDLRDVSFKTPEERTDYIPVMHDDLFRLMSDSACAEVKGFLKLLRREPQDKRKERIAPTFTHDDGPALFAHYVRIRQRDRGAREKYGKRTAQSSRGLRNSFKRRYGLATESFYSYMTRVQRAAFTVIGLYTGGRYSDLTTFTIDCVGELHGMPVLFGTEVKHTDVNAQEGRDVWPAIPIMLDAISCLAEISTFTFNPYLLSPTNTVPIGEQPAPYTHRGFLEAMEVFLSEIDKTGRWEKVSISANSLRHTLAYNLGRLGVNPVYISLQLKHLDDAFRAIPADVTLGYGNLGQLALSRATGGEKAASDLVTELFSSGARIGGGGAKEFKVRRDIYFQGWAVKGYSEEQVLQKVARSGMPFTSVGGGFCGGRRPAPKREGTGEKLPPCLGQTQCNPHDCHQGLVTPSHAPHWIAMVKENEANAADPELAHAREDFELVAKKARAVLKDVGIDPDEQPPINVPDDE
jgi:hypothetical protein